MLRQRAHRKEVAPKRAQKGECDKKAHRGESAPKSIQRRGRKKKRIDKRAQEIVPGEVRAGEVSGRGCMGILEYVLCCGRREEISEYCNRKLYKLEEYEHVLGTPLEDTLLAYYMNGFSVVKTAGALGIHRNSLRYRLQKIWELAGLQEEDWGEYLELVNCILVKQRLQQEGGTGLKPLRLTTYQG